MGPQIFAAMRDALGADRLPRHARYGDNSEIPDNDIARIQEAFRRSATTFPWHSGDVLWMDNLQIAHGRRPFKGERKVLAALMDSSDGS
jgi:alpha-ketoglutarate-dependent taurine dioxygenase